MPPLLAERAKVGGPTGQNCFDNGPCALWTRHIFATIDLKLQLKISGVAAGAEKIGNSGAPGVNGLLQNTPTLFYEPLPGIGG